MFRRNLLQMTEFDGSMTQDFRAILAASHNLGVYLCAAVVGSLEIATVLRWVAVAAALYLFILQRTKWTTNMLTMLLVPYIALNLPTFLLSYLRSEIGYWIAFILVVLRLFFPKDFPPQAELPRALILLVVTAPSTLVAARLSNWGELISMSIGFFLLYEHIIAAGGFRLAFNSERGVPITIGILCLFIAPFWQLSR